jgi:hypothetical protein
MKTEPTKENTLYLVMQKVFFDDIVSGEKTEEFREVKSTTAGRYLIHDKRTRYKLNPDNTNPDKEYFLDDYNGGNFPFIPKDIKYLSLAVGYHKVRDTCIIEVKEISFEADMVRRNMYCFWVAVFHLGKIVEYQKKTK